jgi:hypothetical protein
MISVQATYELSFAFLSLLYLGNEERFSSGLPTLLGGMQLLEDDQPLNPLIAELWVREAQGTAISSDQLFHVLMRFLASVSRLDDSGDIAELQKYLQAHQNDVWSPWLAQSLERLAL